jgi:aldose 1-epimerase
MQITSFGAVGGLPVPGFVMRNRQGIAVSLSALGARIVKLLMPDARGNTADVVLGFDTPDEYLASNAYMGATCGRFSGRLRGSSFALDGAAHRLTANEGAHHLHGGREGFDRRIWRAQSDATRNEAVFALDSPDGDQGYPGALAASVSYRLGDDNVLAIQMRARCDRPTGPTFS